MNTNTDKQKININQKRKASKKLNDFNEKQLLDEEVQIINYGQPLKQIQFEHDQQTRQESLSLIKNLEQQMQDNIDKPIAVITGNEDAEIFSYDVIDYINIPLSDGTIEKAEVQNWALTARTQSSMSGARKKEFELKFKQNYGKKDIKRRFLLTDKEYQLILFSLNSIVSNSQMIKLKQEFLEGKLNGLFSDKEIEIMVNKFLSKQKMEYIIKIPAIRTALSKSEFAKQLDLCDQPNKVIFKKKSDNDNSKKGSIGNELDINLVYHNANQYKTSLLTLIQKGIEAYPTKFTNDVLFHISQLNSNIFKNSSIQQNDMSRISHINIEQNNISASNFDIKQLIQQGFKKIVKAPKAILQDAQTCSTDDNFETQQKPVSNVIALSDPNQEQLIIQTEELNNEAPKIQNQASTTNNSTIISSVQNNLINNPTYKRVFDSISVLKQLNKKGIELTFKLNKRQKTMTKVISIAEDLIKQMNTQSDQQDLLQQVINKADDLFNQKYVDNKLQEIANEFGISPENIYP